MFRPRPPTPSVAPGFQLGEGVVRVCLCYVLTLLFSLSASTPLSYCLAR